MRQSEWRGPRRGAKADAGADGPVRRREPRAPCWAADSETASQGTRKAVTSPDRPSATLHGVLERPKRLTPSPRWARKCHFCPMAHLASLPSKSGLIQNSWAHMFKSVALDLLTAFYLGHFPDGNGFMCLPRPLSLPSLRLWLPWWRTTWSQHAFIYKALQWLIMLFPGSFLTAFFKKR